MSRFHRVDDIYTLDGPKFLRLAWRVAAYRGVLYARITDDSGGRQDDDTVEFAAVALNHPDLFERGRG